MAVLLAANASFIPASPLQITSPELSSFRWGMEELNDRVSSYGYGGIELHWSNIFRHCRELRDASPEQAQAFARGIVSAHECWRGTADPVPADTITTPVRSLHERGSFAVRIASAVLFPTGAASLNQLERTEQKLDLPERWHYVLFPDQQGDVQADQAKTRRFPNSSIQPTVDVAAAWGTRTVSDFVEGLTNRGYKATIDSFHISRAGKVVKDRVNWQRLTQRLLEAQLVPEVHISVGRTDFSTVDPRRYKQSVKELEGLVFNRDFSNTPLSELGQLLRQYKWTGNVVIEATIPGLLATFGKKTGGKLNTHTLADIHSGMTEGVQRMLPHIRWDSPLTQKPATKVTV